jgi:hypothetical protein
MAEAMPEDVIYVELTEPHVDKRFGKLAPGRVVGVDSAAAGRWVRAGIARKVSERAHEKHREERVQSGDRRIAAMEALNDPDAELWDVNYRNAATAPPENLRRAMDAGVPIMNPEALTDEEGIPLNRRASFEDVMAARENMAHPDDDPVFGHATSSVSGNRSHYQDREPTRMPDTTTDAPRRARRARLDRSQIGNGPESDEKEQPKRGTVVGDSLGNVHKE